MFSAIKIALMKYYGGSGIRNCGQTRMREFIGDQYPI